MFDVLSIAPLLGLWCGLWRRHYTFHHLMGETFQFSISLNKYDKYHIGIL